MTDNELTGTIGAGERPGVEFKNARVRNDPSFVEVARVVFGMANRRDGGIVIIGVDDDGNAPGLTEEQAATWTYADHLRQALAPLCDPYVYVDVEVLLVAGGPLAGRRFAIITVQEFDQVPVLCAQQRMMKGKEILKKGACYVRSSHMPATTEIANQQQMRELLELAVDKGVREFLRRARAAGLPVDAAGPPGDEELFAAQREDFDE